MKNGVKKGGKDFSIRNRLVIKCLLCSLALGVPLAYLVQKQLMKYMEYNKAERFQVPLQILKANLS